MLGIGKKIKKKLIPSILSFSKNRLPILYLGVIYLCNLKIFYRIKNKKKIVLKFENNLDNINEYEYKITSQNNEDGLINHIFSKIPNSKKFLEVGFHYSECNCLNLIKEGWEGILIDADKENCRKMKLFIKHYFYKKNIIVKNQFIDKFNLREIVNNYHIDFFSIDIDGNDYWVLKELNLNNIKLICCEYNAFFGNNNAVTLKYNEKHSYKGDFCFGASLKAFTDLLKKKNFELIAIDSSGTNAFFIHKNHSIDFEILDPNTSFKNSGYHNIRESIEIYKKIKNSKKLFFFN